MVVVGNESKTVSVFLAVKQNLLGANVPFLDTEVKDKNLVNFQWCQKCWKKVPQFYETQKPAFKYYKKILGD